MDNGRKFMVEHIELSDIPEFCIEIEKWLKARYGEEEGNKLWELVTKLFMSGFVKLGKLFNLNRSFDMWLINKVFQKIGEKDRKLYAQYPAWFCNISEPYDKKNHAARYHFTQCPNAEFAKNLAYKWYGRYSLCKALEDRIDKARSGYCTVFGGCTCSSRDCGIVR